MLPSQCSPFLAFIVRFHRTQLALKRVGKEGTSFLDSKTISSPKNTPPPTYIPYFCISYIIILCRLAQKLRFDYFLETQ